MQGGCGPLDVIIQPLQQFAGKLRYAKDKGWHSPCCATLSIFETNSYLTKLIAKVEAKVEVGKSWEYYILRGHSDHAHIHGHS